MSQLRLTRREALAGAGALLAGGVLAGPRGAGQVGAVASPASNQVVVIQGVRHALPEDISHLAGHQPRVVQLEADPVRQWRGEQGRLLAARGTRLLGVTTWTQFLLVRGLAEESGRRVRLQRCDAGNGLVTWLIA
jgi:hypothetical protein